MARTYRHHYSVVIVGITSALVILDLRGLVLGGTLTDHS
jgi:hypothetical protein